MLRRVSRTVYVTILPVVKRIILLGHHRVVDADRASSERVVHHLAQERLSLRLCPRGTDVLYQVHRIVNLQVRRVDSGVIAL
jgi:hypothetical protein